MWDGGSRCPQGIPLFHSRMRSKETWENDSKKNTSEVFAVHHSRAEAGGFQASMGNLVAWAGPGPALPGDPLSALPCPPVSSSSVRSSTCTAWRSWSNSSPWSTCSCPSVSCSECPSGSPRRQCATNTASGHETPPNGFLSIAAYTEGLERQLSG